MEFLQHATAPAVSISPAVVAVAQGVPKDAGTVEVVAASVCAAIPDADFVKVAEAVASGSAPPEWDSMLLKAGVKGLGQNPLEDDTKRNLRKAFKAAVRKRTAASAPSVSSCVPTN